LYAKVCHAHPLSTAGQSELWSEERHISVYIREVAKESCYSVVFQ
jgi:hypothetical protein